MNLGTERKEVENNTDTIPAVTGTDDLLHTAKDLLRSCPVLAAVEGGWKQTKVRI